MKVYKLGKAIFQTDVLDGIKYIHEGSHIFKKYQIWYPMSDLPNIMHELPITQNILKIALQYAEKEGANHILTLNLVIGQLSTVIDDSVQFYWPIVSEGTIAENAVLHFRRIPAQLKCLECETNYRLEDGRLRPCPNCDSSRISVLSGREFQLESIQID